MDTTPRPLQCITLEPSDYGPLVIPAGNANEPGDDVHLILPQLPGSLTTWLGGFGLTVWERHRRCALLLLLINPDRMSWGVTVPPQSGRQDGVSWQVADTLPHSDMLPDPMMVGGSFQTTRLRSPDDAADIVPPTDGVHLVQPVSGRLNGCWIYLRIGGELDTTFLEDVIIDDWQVRVEEVMQYLDLED